VRDGVVTWLFDNADVVGIGYAFINLAVTGSQRFCGIWFPGNGERVTPPPGAATVVSGS
jgi:hypothetical protein